jgi:hypothetical protein
MNTPSSQQIYIWLLKATGTGTGTKQNFSNSVQWGEGSWQATQEQTKTGPPHRPHSPHIIYADGDPGPGYSPPAYLGRGWMRGVKYILQVQVTVLLLT